VSIKLGGHHPLTTTESKEECLLLFGVAGFTSIILIFLFVVCVWHEEASGFKYDTPPLQRGLTLPITLGMRAVTIGIGGESAEEGWTLPGARVDVVLTYKVENFPVSRVITQNAKVLSYNGDATLPSERPVDRRPVTVNGRSTVTLEASPSDSLKIHTAKEIGILSLLVRSLEDESTDSELEVSKYDLDRETPSRSSMHSPECSTFTRIIEGKEYVFECDRVYSAVSSQ